MKMQSMKAEGLDNMELWNKAQPYYCRQLAFAFGDYYYFLNIKKVMEKAGSNGNKQILAKVILLWAFGIFVEEKFMDR